ncbi:MAG: DMT family transporter [Acidimicrobiia bacterium]|nr:DMT family transporter [Acidimicrobiia bacterium]
MNRLGTGRCLAAAVLFGASAPAASKLAGEMPALVLAGLLYLGAGVAVTPSVLRSPPTMLAVQRDWRPATVAVLVGGALGPALLVAGLARTSAASASILLNLELAATVLLAATVFREHLGTKLVAGAAIVTAAGVILVWEPGAEVNVGALFIAGACVAWGVDNGVTAKIDQLAPEHIVFLKGLVAGGANLALGVSFADRATSPSLEQVVIALVVGALGYGASIVLWVKGARDLGAARGQVIFATAPFLGALIAWMILGESVSLVQLVAIALAATGVAISMESGHEHEHDHHMIEHEHEHSHDDGHHEHTHDGLFDARHTHLHRHERTRHAHPHVPDLHHRHTHHG